MLRGQRGAEFGMSSTASARSRPGAIALTFATAMALTASFGSVHAYSDDGSWTRQFGTTGLDEVKAVAVDGTGTTYVAGETFGTLPGQTPGGTLDAFVRTYDPAGRELWTRQFGAWERDIAWGVAVDRVGSAYVVGQTEGILPGQHSSGGWDAFIRKYDSSGTELWTRQFGGGGADIASGVAVDPAGGIYVVGTTSSALPGQATAGSFDAFLRRYSPAGDDVWTAPVRYYAGRQRPTGHRGFDRSSPRGRQHRRRSRRTVLGGRL